MDGQKCIKRNRSIHSGNSRQGAFEDCSASGICNTCRLDKEFCPINNNYKTPKWKQRHLKRLPQRHRQLSGAQKVKVYEHFTITDDTKNCFSSCFMKIEDLLQKLLKQVT